MSTAIKASGLTGAMDPLLAALPVAVYTIDTEGYVTGYNDAAVRLWGQAPPLGEARWCGSYKVFQSDGSPQVLEDSPVARTLKTGIAAASVEVMLQRPDGSRAWFLPHPTPLFDESGRIRGVMNMLVDITQQKTLENSQGHFSAIVESSEDAILSKTLTGTILSWNKGAERIFGYTAREAIGQPVLMLIPEDRHDEEPGIIARIRAGERVNHFETVRRRKDGTLMDISLTISPVKNARGEIVGASKIARDISDRRLAEQKLEAQSTRLDTLNQIAKLLSSDLDQERIVQSVTDIATELSGAQFGAFFYNINDPSGAALQLYTLSGASREAFEKMGRPRATPVFGATLMGGNTVRSGDIRKDPRYGQMAPHHGMPQGHLPVVSYMAVPVTSRAGEVMGALLFAHDSADAFTAEHQALVEGIASHAAIAMDNARLHMAAHTEVTQRKKAEETKDLLLHEIKHRVKNTLGTVQAIAAQTFRAAPPEERESFGARLRAMSEAHDLLTNQDWGHVKVAVVVARAIAPFDHQRFIQDGDDTTLPASEALLLAMALHELGTNAVKYGALSNRSGHVTLHWQTRDGNLVFRWHETGGPPVTPPTRKGFGTNLLLRAITGEQGKARMDFQPEGLVAELEMRLSPNSLQG